jgi:hypothetical protein
MEMLHIGEINMKEENIKIPFLEMHGKYRKHVSQRVVCI